METWKSIFGYEGRYEVSDLGNVRRVGGKLLRPVLTAGYYVVTLCKDGASKNFRVHRLVAEAFLGPLPDGMQTLHGPEGKTVNHVGNLRYGTQPENEADKRRDGTALIGEAANSAKLTEEQVRSIREAYRPRGRGGLGSTALAARYGVNSSTILRIVQGQQWRHI